MLSPDACAEELRRRKYEFPFLPFEIETLEGGRYQVFKRMKFAATKRTVIVLDGRDQNYRLPISKVKAIKTLMIPAH